MEEIDQRIPYVPESDRRSKKILICIGGLGYEVTAEHIAMQMAMKSRAEVTLLHIVPPISITPPRGPSARTENLTATDTPVGRSLRQALEVAKGDGLTAFVKARQGNVVEEILAEIKDGNYDLLCMGSPYSTHALRQLYAPNVTAEIAEGTTCPIYRQDISRDNF